MAQRKSKKSPRKCDTSTNFTVFTFKRVCDYVLAISKEKPVCLLLVHARQSINFYNIVFYKQLQKQNREK